MTKEQAAPHHHITPLRTYLAVGVALFIQTGITVAISFIPLGGWNAIVAIGLASIKGVLVALIFMHLLYDKKIYLVVFVAALLFLAVFIALTMFDTLSRGDIHEISEHPIKGKAVIYDAPAADTLPPGADSLQKEPPATD